MTTIKDVAKHANVSVATVSNVLNKTANVSEEKMARVIAAMEQLKYSPNPYAKNLRFKKSKFFAIVISAIDLTTQRIIEGITDACEEYGYICNLYVTHHNRVQEANYLSELQAMGVNGIFLQTCDNEPSDTLLSVLAKDLPIVFVDNYIKNYMKPTVIFNNAAIVEDAFDEYFREHDPLSKEDILFVSAGNRYSNDVDAMIGAERALSGCFLTYAVPAAEAEAFYHLVKYFESCIKFPSLIFSTRESVTAAICRMLDYYKREADVIYLTNDSSICTSPHRFPLRRRAYHLGTIAAETMFHIIKSPLNSGQHLTMIENQKCTRENIRFSYVSSLHLTLYDGPTSAALIPAIKSFENTTGIQMDYTLLKYDELFERIDEIGKEKSDETDILMIDLPWFDIFHRPEFLHPMNTFINEDKDEWLGNYSDEIKKIFFYTDSIIFSVPILTNMQYMFYRRDLFENQELMRSFYKKYGVELAPPRTWREFEMVAKFFTQAYNPASPVVYGTTLQGMDPVSIAEEFFPRQWSYGGKLLSSRKIPVLNRQENCQAFLNLKNIYECTPKEHIEPNWETNFTKMTNNEIAMYFNFSTHIGSENGIQYSIDFSNIAVTQAPGIYSMLGGYNLGINAYSKRKEAAYRFIKWLTSGEMAINNTLMGCCIPHNAVLQNDSCINAFPWLKNMQKYILSARRRESVLDANNRRVPPKVINALLYDAAMRIFDGQNIQEVLNRSNEQLNDIIYH